MKRSVLLGLMVTLLAFTSCKSKESAYKQAYEKAKAQETMQVQVNAPMQVTPIEVAPSGVEVDYESAPVRQEQVDVVAVNGTLKAYSVVCGSFSLQTNAQALKEYLVGEGYEAGIVKNVQKNMFRVIIGSYEHYPAGHRTPRRNSPGCPEHIGSYETKSEAAKVREAFKMRYPSRADFQGSWILLNK